MDFLLDTNICSAHIRHPAGMAARFIQFGGRLFVPTIVLAELFAGAYRSDNPPRLLMAIDVLKRDLTAVPFDEAAAVEFGKVKGSLSRQGIVISPVDLMIASVAIARDMTLITHNVKDFLRVPGLRLDDWLVTS
jgi:tRNA(fMet)-specific endonuclease VapC